MTKLLVSVRDAREAQTALDGGADLIDIKEPQRGSLGRADARTITEIAHTVAGRAPLSAAWGELCELPGDPGENSAAGLQFAKVGLAGSARQSDWARPWLQWSQALPHGVQPVAVAYADWRNCAAPSPDAVLRLADEASCAAVLVDTYDKRQGDLLAHWSLGELRHFVAEIGKAGRLSVVAGSLTLDALERVLPLEPSYVAVRGAVCRGDRTGPIDAALVAAWAAALGSFRACRAARRMAL